MPDTLENLLESMELGLNDQQQEELIKTPEFEGELIEALNGLAHIPNLSVKDLSAGERQALVATFFHPHNRTYLGAIVFAIHNLRTTHLYLFLDENILERISKHRELWKKLSALPSPDNMVMRMQPFMADFGSIKYRDALLILAERKQRKIYEFEPCLLREREIQPYLACLKASAYPLTGRFLVEASHWIAGEIRITAQGEIKVILLDSAGRSFPKLLNNMVASLIKIFADRPIKILFDPRVLQAGQGCSVYAFDFLVHLFTVGKYLPKKYGGDLFKYLEDHPSTEFVMTDKDGKEVKFEETPAPVFLVSLPLSLVRGTMLLSAVPELLSQKSADEVLGPTNKRGERFEEVLARELVFDSKLNKTINARMRSKLDKIANRVFDFLCAHTSRAIDKITYPFTLDGFLAKKERETLQAGGFFQANQWGESLCFAALCQGNYGLAIKMLCSVSSKELLQLDQALLKEVVSQTAELGKHLVHHPSLATEMIDRIFILFNFFLETLDFSSENKLGEKMMQALSALVVLDEGFMDDERWKSCVLQLKQIKPSLPVRQGTASTVNSFFPRPEAPDSPQKPIDLGVKRKA